MTIYYVGPGGNDANNGTSWALRKLTLNGAEDIPVAAADTVYVGPGTYRETLTVDVSGSAGSPISYIGDYDGSHTDGIGGVVRITGSDDDKTAARQYCIYSSGRGYRTFRGLHLSACTSNLIQAINGASNWTIDECVGDCGASGFFLCGHANDTAITISNCFATSNTRVVNANTAVSNGNSLIASCVFIAGYAGQGANWNIGGTTIRNSVFIGGGQGIICNTPGTGAGEFVTVNNCIITLANVAISSSASGEVVEDYNNIYACSTARTNVDVGANSLAYPPLLDARWFFEMVNGGKMATPFDLSAASQLLNVAGTSPTTTDMRGTAVIGAQREWGPLEYDTTLILPALAEVTEAGGGTYHEPSVGEVLDSAVYGPASGTSGTYHAPDVVEVLDSAVYGPASATAGTYHAPDVGEVIDTAVFGPASGTSGTFAVPTPAQVEAGVGYGEDGTEFEGELVAGGGGAPFSPLIGYLGG